MSSGQYTRLAQQEGGNEQQDVEDNVVHSRDGGLDNLRPTMPSPSQRRLTFLSQPASVHHPDTSNSDRPIIDMDAINARLQEWTQTISQKVKKLAKKATTQGDGLPKEMLSSVFNPVEGLEIPGQVSKNC